MVRSESRSFLLGNGQLSCGIDAVVDCVGSEESLAQALRVAAPGGTIHAVGMPGVTTLDLTPLWHREIRLRGAYAYTTGQEGEPDDFGAAIELIRELGLERLVSATYPLARYQDAIAHAATAGRRGAVKVAFDLRNEKERFRL
jgi:threonine dehydrogenase-like Zn-dependent dehydrogenase